MEKEFSTAVLFLRDSPLYHECSAKFSHFCPFFMVFRQICLKSKKFSLKIVIFDHFECFIIYLSFLNCD